MEPKAGMEHGLVSADPTNGPFARRSLRLGPSEKYRSELTRPTDPVRPVARSRPTAGPAGRSQPVHFSTSLILFSIRPRQVRGSGSVCKVRIEVRQPGRRGEDEHRPFDALA